MKHRRKVNGEQKITLQIVQQLKTKIINFKPEQLFCRLWKAKFLLETQTHCIDGDDNVQFVTDSDNEFTQYQTARKKLQSTGISPVSSHALPQHNRITDVKLKLDEVMNTIKSDISEGYKVQDDCLEDSESDSYGKSDMKGKANQLVRLYETIQE